jgi:hypothetical protein
VISTGFVNRQGAVLNGTTDATKNLLPLWQFGSASAASVAPTLVESPARAAPKLPSKEEDEKLKKEFDEGLKKELESKPNHKK